MIYSKPYDAPIARALSRYERRVPPTLAWYFSIMLFYLTAIRQLKFSALLLLVLICAVVIPTYAALPKAFSATYSIHAKGAKVAEMQRQLTPQADGQLLFESKTRTTGLISLFKRIRVVEQSRASVHEGSLRPLHYHYHRQHGDNKTVVTVEFDWEKGRIANTASDHTWHLGTIPGILDKMLYHIILMHDLASGARDIEYQIADGGKIKRYRFEVLAEETLDTRLGELETLKLRHVRSDSKREQTFWCAPALHFLPVRVESQEKDGSITTANIREFSGWESLKVGKALKIGTGHL